MIDLVLGTPMEVTLVLVALILSVVALLGFGSLVWYIWCAWQERQREREARLRRWFTDERDQ